MMDYSGTMGYLFNSTSYQNTYMYEKVLPHYARILQKELNFNIAHIDGEPELHLLRKVQLYGNPKKKIECLPLFKQFPELRMAGTGINNMMMSPYWIQEEGVTGYLSNEGTEFAPNRELGVRPYFYIG